MHFATERTYGSIPPIMLLGAGIGLFCGLAPTGYSAPVAILTIGLLIGALLASCFKPEDFKFLFFLFAGSFLLRIAVATVLYSIFSFSDWYEGFFIRDGLGYSSNGWWMAQHWLAGISVTKGEIVSRTGTISDYDVWNAMVYYTVGKSPLSLFFINCLAGALSVIFTYLIASQLFNNKAARISALFAAFWPSLFLWSTQNLKEPITVLCVLIIIWAFVSFRNRRFGAVEAVLMYGAFLALGKFRNIWVYVLAMAMILSFVFPDLRLRRILFFILLGFFMFLAVTPILKELAIAKILNFYIEQDVNVLTSNIPFLEHIDYLRRVRLLGGSAFMPNVDISSFKGAAMFLPVGLLYVLFSPFPWQASSMLQVLALPETVAWYFLVPFLVISLRFSFATQWRRISVMVFFAVMVCAILALIEGNFGTIFRHRAVLFPIFFIFTGAGMAAGKNGGV